MLNASAVDNRPRYPVRGRVIVFTTSRNIEFVQDGLNFSYPLFSVPFLPPGCGLSFLIEISGQLTFELGSEVRISPEVARFHNYHFDPSAVAIVRPAGLPIPPIVTSLVFKGFNIQDNSGSSIYAIAFSDNSFADFTGPSNFSFSDALHRDEAYLVAVGLTRGEGGVI